MTPAAPPSESPSAVPRRPWGGLVVLGAACLLGGCAATAATPPTPNVIVVSLDTTRADRLGAYGNPNGLTPNLDRFAQEAVVFEHAYAQATSTSPSHASLFTSRYPSEVFGPGRTASLTDATPTLATVLGAYDYQTVAFVGAGDLSPEIGVGKGFAEYNSIGDFASFYHTIPPALAWLDQRSADKPFFAFIHGYDAHSPYLKPTPWGYTRGDPAADTLGQQAVRSRTERIMDGLLMPDIFPLEEVQQTLLRPRSAQGRRMLAQIATELAPRPEPIGPGDVAAVRHAYDGAVAYSDTLFGLLMAGLQQRGLLENTIIVVLADHGEQLGEDGLFFRFCGVSDADAHVPLMVRLPKAEGGGARVGGLVELVDVMPTLLELTGAVPPAGIRGTSLVPALRGQSFPGRDVAYTQGGFEIRWISAANTAGRVTYLGVPPTSPHVADFVAAARLDGPSFTVDPGLDPAAGQSLRDGMAGWLRTLARGREKAHQLSPELVKSLKEHGYFDADGQ